MAARKKKRLLTNSKFPVSRAVVLLSGGLDSSTVLSIAKAEGHELYALSFDYNQRHIRELESARLVADALNVKKHLIVKFDLREIGSSALTAEIEVPKKAQKRGSAEAGSKELKNLKTTNPITKISALPHFQSSGLIPVTYVPARNTIFLSFALAWAEVLEAEDIFIGANAIDYSGYPDCRPEYLDAFEKMANLATKASIEGKMRFAIHAPLVSMTKSEIIRKGTELGLDYSLTWSCYDPQKDRNALSVKRNMLKKKTRHTSRITHHDLIPCRQCDSCRFREKGFKEAGIRDPILVF